MRHMTQEELAEKVGVSISFCANIERGKKGVSMFVLRDFADALDITVNQLLYDRKDNQHIENIVVLLQDKSVSYLSWLEQVIRIPNDAFLNSK
ncbi:MAG: helix-turn-helix transcriptional regulator [Acutalibacter sp.]|nr:helix-turn-helix transcriptional regulator [Acutalibacter sp.]